MKGPVRSRRMPSASVVKLGGVPMAAAPWVVSDGLWELVEPLLPVRERRFRYPGRKRLPDRQALQGILFVLHTGMWWTHLPSELGFGSGVTCWRRLDEWQRAGVWERLHQLLLARLRAAGEIEWSRAVVDASHVQAKRGAPRRARARSTEPETAPSTTSWSARHQSRDRPTPNRARLRPRPLPLGCRAHLRLAAPIQAAARPLRPPRRHPRSLPRHRLLPRLLPPTQERVIVKGALRPRGLDG